MITILALCFIYIVIGTDLTFVSTGAEDARICLHAETTSCGGRLFLIMCHDLAVSIQDIQCADNGRNSHHCIEHKDL